MVISGLSGNEIYCLSLKGFAPGEIVVGNSVWSLGVGGSLRAFGRTLAGGEIANITSLISEGRHAAIARMEAEAKHRGASGVSGVTADLKRLAGYTEFIAQGTAVHAAAPTGPFFSTAASGIELYCHLDAGYRPVRFALGNVAYALGVGRGLMGSLRVVARGEVKEFSQMYNEIRHTALARLRKEAAEFGANAVVDVTVRILPFGPGTVELLMTGTASHHERLAGGKLAPEQVVTSELDGEELWNLAQLGLVPKQLVLATSVYSLGMISGIGAMFQSLSRGELPEVTKLIYEARENCLDLVRREAQALGAERVIGNKLTIMELQPGVIEIVAMGTAVVPAEGFKPESPTLISQAVISEEEPLEVGNWMQGLSTVQPQRGLGYGGQPAQANPAGCLIALIIFFIMGVGMAVAALLAVMGGRH